MNVIKLTPDEQNNIIRILSLILWLGNVQFEEMEDGNSRIADPGVTAFIAYLMETDEASVDKVLTMRTMETGGKRGESALTLVSKSS
jgi:myosin I